MSTREQIMMSSLSLHTEKRKKKVESARERVKGQERKKDIRTVDDIRKRRNLKERRREKNARPSRKSEEIERTASTLGLVTDGDSCRTIIVTIAVRTR
jgi:hypothetical protein